MAELLPVDQMPYEIAFAELEKILASLEENKCPLDEALSLFERGQSLAARCSALLDQAELKVRQLSGEDLLDEAGEKIEE